MKHIVIIILLATIPAAALKTPDQVVPPLSTGILIVAIPYGIVYFVVSRFRKKKSE